MLNGFIRTTVLASALVMSATAAFAQAPNPGRADKSGGGAAEMSSGSGTTASGSACDVNSMKMAESSTMKMSNASMKADAMKELDMAKAMMAKNDMAGCKMHMDKAMGMMK